MIAGDITTQHLGRPILDLGVANGWEGHLVLTFVQQQGETTLLRFAWNDDDDPANTRRGRPALGFTVPADTSCRVD